MSNLAAYSKVFAACDCGLLRSWRCGKLVVAIAATFTLLGAFVAEQAFGEFSPGSADDPNPLVAVSLSAPATTIDTGESLQLTVTVEFFDGTVEDRTSAASGTTYSAIDGVATVDADGLALGLLPGEATILAQISSGHIGELSITVLEIDTDGDGMPDHFETANGLNPSDPADGLSPLAVSK